MIQIYLILLGIKIIAIAACSVYCFLIAKFKMTPTFTYILLSLAFFILCVLQIETAINSKIILGFLGNFSFATLLQNYILTASYSGLFLVAVVRKYKAVSIIYNQKNEIH